MAGQMGDDTDLRLSRTLCTFEDFWRGLQKYFHNYYIVNLIPKNKKLNDAHAS